MQADAATDTLAAIRSAGITGPVLGGDAIGSNRFLTGFASFPEEQADPGVFTNGLMAASPLIMDSLTSDSLRWQEAFRAAYGTDPTWRGATTYDAAIAATTAMRAAAMSGEEGARAADRQLIRDALAALDSPENAVPGLLGPIYFDEGNTTPRPAAFGLARDQQYASAFVQLRPYSPSGGAGLAADLESGAAMEVEGQMLGRQRVVFAGVNMNEIGELDTTNLKLLRRLLSLVQVFRRRCGD